MDHKYDRYIDPGMFMLDDVYEAKILLAYFMFQMDRPFTPMQLYEICDASGVMDYFIYTAAVTDMIKSGLIDVVIDGGIEQYVLSEKGKAGAEDFKEVVLPSVRKKIYATGLMFFARLKNERDVTFEITEHGKGYLV